VIPASVTFVGKLRFHLLIRVISNVSSQSWNIYHLACLSQNAKRVKFVVHLLKTLPEELTHELMAQTSREALNIVRFPLSVAGIVSLIRHFCSL
jgi:hypothetical protein